MAEYFTRFSARLPMTSESAAHEALLALDGRRKAGEADGDPNPEGFEAAYDHLDAAGRPVVWLHSRVGSPDNVVAFVQDCAERGLTEPGLWTLIWSFDCSKPRLNGYGGGACIVDLATGAIVERIDLNHWACVQTGRLRATERDGSR
ncbi:hypothetical protein AA12717_2169 [Gluconacetobacter sacchari DSM 12717]|uniref:Uncharacterized protein n=2 Tax=Gluconacetobacter sacchari TaxID=92759 RepID=A0A7W4NT54_9PROT|nr:hypothetical protein [Gluconacetobacter sacchari]MBB2162763.1 hypothetical protein [Gluconacetobacter sacchari]GBQ25774.1 hypothetical protein AA12717_2169 [Gluconacetobacter sacchari DSM 12717]